MVDCVQLCATSQFDPRNAYAVRLCHDVIAGNGLMGSPSMEKALNAGKAAGFDIMSTTDLALTADIPWYEPLCPEGFSLASFRSSPAGRRLTNQMLSILEALRIVPHGSRAVSTMLNDAAQSLVESGRAGSFRPDFLTMVGKTA